MFWRTRKTSPNSPSADGDLFCSFCNKSQHEVRSLIAGPTVFICDECVEVCNDILSERKRINAAHVALAAEAADPYDLPPNQSPNPSAHSMPCRLCAMPTPLDEGLILGERGVP